MTYRRIEQLGVILGSFALLHGHWLLVDNLDLSFFSFGLLMVSLFGGLIAADFISGTVHWFADTFGDESWPILGASLIRPFREHHVDPTSITRHDFIETNGSSFLLVGLTWFSIYFFAKASVDHRFLGAIAPTFLFLCVTNEIHKMAHLADESRAWHRALASKGLVLSASAHRFHHSGKFNSHYCITTGWLNNGLERLRFFTKLESVARNTETFWLQIRNSHYGNTVDRVKIMSTAPAPPVPVAQSAFAAPEAPPSAAKVPPPIETKQAPPPPPGPEVS